MTPRMTPERPLTYELLNTGPMPRRTPFLSRTPEPSNKKYEPPSHPKKVCKRNNERDILSNAGPTSLNNI